MTNIVYRKGTVPTINGATVYKNYPLTNDELDGNFYGLEQELTAKAPIANATFTGSTTIPNINTLGGAINGTVIGGTSQAAGSFTTLVSTSSSLLGSVPSTAVSLFSTSTGTINLGGAGSNVAIGNNASVAGDLTISGGDISINQIPVISAIDVGQPVSLFATSTAGITIGSNTNGTTAVRYDFSVGRNTTLTGSVTMGGSPSITASTVANTVSLFSTSTGTINLGGAGSTVAIGNNATIGGTLTVTGNTTLNGNTTLGNAVGDSVTITAGTIAGSPNFTGSPTLLTFPIVNTQTAQTLLNKTINLADNTLVATSAQLLAAVTDETGSGSLVFSNSPVLTTPNIGAASASSLSASGNVSGQTITSTVAIGTAPMTVTSTTKVTNLNSDRVDDIAFGTPTATGGVPYVSATAAGNHTVSFIGAGTSGTILSSTGGGAPAWIAISGLSAGSSKAAEHILGGAAGDMLYQNSKSVSATTTLNSTTVTVDVTGLSAGMVISGNGNIPGGAYIVSVGASTIVISEQATAAGTASTTFTETKKVPIGTNNQVLTSNGSIPVWSTNLTVGALSHTGLTPTAGTNIDQLYSVTETLTVTTSWVDTSVNAAELATGSYMIQLLSGTELYTGVMSWYSSDINSAVVDEIVLHKASAGSETSALFLRVERTDNAASPDMTLQISSSSNRASTSYTFKFRRLI